MQIKIKAILLFIIMLCTIFYTTSSYALTCVRINEINIKSTSFTNLTVHDIFSSVMNNHGYKVIQKSTNFKRIKTPNLAGPVVTVLDDLSNIAGVKYKINNVGCFVTLYNLDDDQNESIFVLKEGKPIHEELIRWASAEQWKLVWVPSISWRVYSDATYVEESALKAIIRVIENLRDEGKPLKMSIFEGNRVIEITSNEIKN